MTTSIIFAHHVKIKKYKGVSHKMLDHPPSYCDVIYEQTLIEYFIWLCVLFPCHVFTTVKAGGGGRGNIDCDNFIWKSNFYPSLFFFHVFVASLHRDV